MFDVIAKPADPRNISVAPFRLQPQMTEDMRNNPIKSHHVLLLVCLVLLLLVFCFRRRLTEAFERYRNNRRWYTRVSGFQEDMENGLSSSNFDISSNLSGDSRNGLEEDAKSAIRNIMESQNVTFDEARLVYTRSKMGQNGVGENGVPLDPKTVTFG